MKILLTGASGFIGQALRKEINKIGFFVRSIARNSNLKLDSEISELENIITVDMDPNTNWSKYLSDIKCIIHCAAELSKTTKIDFDKLATYQKINVQATRNLAQQAASIGVKRFIFLSTIGVNGESTPKSLRFKYNDTPKPKTAYAISKWEAEKVLMEISARTGLEVVIIRPPLVYGENVKGNFLSLLKLIDQSPFLPFAKIDNFRSFIGLDNLLDLIICCIDHPKAAGQTFLASDGEDISTIDLIKKLSKFMHKNVKLLYIPDLLFKLGFYIAGKSSKINSLTSSLLIDNLHTFQTLGWRPKVTVDQGLYKTVQWYSSR
jgi:nucleoside-diphosphate-sugar epimerase